MVALGLRLVPQRLAENANCRAKLRRPIARGDCPAPGALRPPSRTLSATVDKPQGSLFAGAARNRCGTVAAAASLRLYSNTYTGSARHVPRLVSARIVSPAKPEASQQHFSIAPRHQVRTAWYFHFAVRLPERCSESVFAGFGKAVLIFTPECDESPCQLQVSEDLQARRRLATTGTGLQGRAWPVFRGGSTAVESSLGTHHRLSKRHSDTHTAVASPSMTKFNFKQPSAATSATSATQSVRPGDGGAAPEGVTRPVLSTNSSSSAFNFGPKANKATDAVLALGLDACPLKTSHSSESQPTFAISKNPNRLKEMQKPSPSQTGASEFVCLSQVAAARSCQVSLQQR